MTSAVAASIIDPLGGITLSKGYQINMFSTAILDVAIGTIFVYLLLSLVCTAIHETIAAIFRLRAGNLEKGVRSLFSDGIGPEDKAFVAHIYDHGLIAGLYRDPKLDLVKTRSGEYRKPGKGGPRKLPSYIPSRTFALALIDVLNRDRAQGKDVALSVRSTLDALPESKARQALLSLMADANGECDKLRDNIEDWFNAGMDRAAGWYKRQTQYLLLVIGLVVAVLANADSINIVRTLYVDPGIREATVQSAANYLNQSSNSSCEPDPGDPEDVRDLKVHLCSLQKKIDVLRASEGETLLPLGWNQGLTLKGFGNWQVWLGWLLTAVALSLGAPFWFDLLNKFMIVRSTIKPDEKSPTEKSKS